ncbi:MAG TPA: transketolase [Rickettsiales bacterium]|nr:transketolase [Rickettsiales bacterium]
MKKLDNSQMRELANCIRFLSIDAVQRANSGHPGMPMGMADVATVLFSEFLHFNPKQPKWLNRDRFILSAGHGSMLLYSLLYLTGYEDITIEDIKNFRQLHAKTPGHPEYSELAGIETTTGPLGQGLANAVGMALAAKLLAARVGDDIINHKTYCIVGDGCLMEGISQEAISISGHLCLNNLVVLWDNNSISIDGDVALASSENMKMRFEACGWKVLRVDGHNYDEIRKGLKAARKQDKPVMIDCKTVIAYGSPNKSGSEASHGSPLGDSEIALTRKQLNWSYAPFEIPDELLEIWRQFGKKSAKSYKKWAKHFQTIDEVKKSYISRLESKELPADFSQKFAEFKQKIFDEKPKQATRKSSQIMLEFLTTNLPALIGGSADLTGSVLTKTSHTNAINAKDFSGSYIHYGVREHAMASMMNGIALHSGFIPYGGTFLVFSDYMKPAMRLAAMMKQQVIYILTHDSIGLGEDGPTHQPIEHLAMLRAIPNLNVFRPADAVETAACFIEALKHKETPSALVLTRQNVKFLQNELRQDDNFCARGAYIISDTNTAKPDFIIFATGSEVEIAIEAQAKLQEKGLTTRVVSAPCLEIFDKQDQAYKNKIFGEKNIIKIAIEAGIIHGWNKYIGEDGIFVGMSSFGASAKSEDLYKHFKITADRVVELALASQ